MCSRRSTSDRTRAAAWDPTIRSSGRTSTRAAEPGTPLAATRSRAFPSRSSSINLERPLCGPLIARVIQVSFARMSTEEEQIQQRRANLAELERLGVDAYPHRCERSATVTDLVKAHSEK